MKTKLTWILTFVAALCATGLVFTSACSRPSPNSASVRFNWIPSCSFAGEVLGTKESSAANNLKLTLRAGGPGIDPIKLVQSGTDTFGIAGADLVLSAVDKGADLVVVGLVSFDSPGVWISKREKNIHGIGDLKGKRIGELPGGNMIFLYEVLLATAKLQRNRDFTPVPIPFDFKNFLTSDECDLRPVFIYDETTELDRRGIAYDVIEPRKLGINFKGLCYFCTRQTLERDSDLVQRFVNTMALGWISALKDPAKAIAALAEFDPTIDREKETLGLRNGRSYFQGYQGKVLSSDRKSWEEMAKTMQDLGFLSQPINLDRVLQFQFVENFHRNPSHGGDK